MKSGKKGIPKLRLPEGLEGVVRRGKIKYFHENFFIVEVRHHGNYFFRKEYSKIFNHPTGDFGKSSKVLCCFHGHGKELYYPYKVCNSDNTKIFYEEKY